MKKILITGFEPFGGEAINPSWEAVSLLASEINGYSLIKLRIPVVFGEAFERVAELAKEVEPDIIICVGQAGGRDAITPELVGINLRYAKIPDNKGNQPNDEPVIADGESAYFSTLPVRKMAEALNNLGIASRLSYSAGAYVCNDLLYSLLALYSGSNTRVGFIHVPYSHDQAKEPSMALSDIVKGLTVAIENID